MKSTPPYNSLSRLSRLLIVAGILSLVVFFFRDYLGVRFGFFGVVVWLAFLTIPFFAGIAYYALFIVPAGVENWYTEGMQLIWHYFVTGRPEETPPEREGIPPSIDTLGAGVVESHIALALGEGGGFSRAVGPGYIKLDRGESIRHVMDLRPHIRHQRLKAMTHDGIPLEAVATVVFRLRREPEGEVSFNEPFPYDKKAIFEASYFSSVGEGGGEILWIDHVAPIAAAAFVTEMSNNRLDQLYPFDEGQQPNPGAYTRFEKLTSEVFKRLEKQLHEKGVELVDLQLTEIELPEDITAQRIDHLQTQWQQEIQVAQADDDVVLLTQLEEARTTAEVELIRQIVDTIERLNVTDQEELSDVIAVVTIEALENAALEEQLNVHPQILQTLSQVQAMFTPPGKNTPLPPQLPAPQRPPQLPAHSRDTELYDSSLDGSGKIGGRMSDAYRNKQLGISVFVLLVLLIWLAGWYMERIDFRLLPPDGSMPYIGPVALILANRFPLLTQLFSWRVLRHLIPVAAGWWLSRQAAFDLVQVLFDLPSQKAAKSFLTRAQSTENPPGPAITLKRKDFTKDRLQMPLLRYGGPGYIKIIQGDVAWTERNGRFQRVLGSGKHLLERYEYVRGVLDLRIQERSRSSVPLVTRDGLELETQVTVMYHIDRGDHVATERNPFPYDEDAVRLAGYTEMVLIDGHIDGWDTLPLRLAIETLRQIIGRRTIDNLLFRETAKPLDDIQIQLERETRRLLKQRGIFLMSVRLGRLEIPDAVTQQRIDQWQAHWQGRQRRREMLSQSETLVRLEKARAEAKASAIERILTSMRDGQQILRTGGTREMVALRLVDALERINRQSQTGLPGRELASRINRIRDEIKEP